MRQGTVRVVFNSSPVEIRKAEVVLEVNGQRQDVPNDYVWVFAGGIPPNDFLKKIGITIGARDLTEEARAEARLKGLAA